MVQKVETVYLIDDEHAHVVECNSGSERQALMQEHELDDDSCVCDFYIEGETETDDYTEWDVSENGGETWTHAYRAYNAEEGERVVERILSTRGVTTADYS